MEDKQEKKIKQAKESSKKISKWFRDCKGEMKKVIWPSKQQLINNTWAVLCMVIISVIFISALDMIFSLPLKYILKKF